ncbi:protein lin-54 homolog isoform X1 [Anopheles gambiae]|uniref:CRC domain-containing protein n=1 Tax=Anopheles coluzzii TaxID=1518534 RepID=A0A6E8W2U4_ANOCL|nr:protein lin-54 homolog isoform X1 [Anopheles coluzzii]XP_061513972.1 protein lin-54 homolog isoform X1 [Anopheles gambiae]
MNMEDLRDIEDESYADSQDMVEYTSEEQEDEQEEVEHGTMDVDLEDLVEETNHPEVSTDEEYENYEDDEKPSRTLLPDNSNTVQTFQHVVSLSGLQKVGNNSGIERSTSKVMMVPQSSTATTAPMKLLNAARPSLPSTAATTSYRLLNSDGTMIVNVSNKSGPTKKVISVSSPVANPPNQTNRVVLNTNARVMHIQPQNMSASTGAGLKTMTVGKTITMKTIAGGAIKMASQTTPLTSGTVVRVAKPAVAQPGALAGTSSVTKQNVTIGGTDVQKVILKPGVGNTATKKIIAPSSGLHAVTLPGGKGVQYVRLLNQRPTTSGGTVQKIVLKSPSKIHNSASSSVAATTGTAVSSTGISGTIQTGSPKIIMQNNRTFVVRNGAGNLAAMPTTSSLGKPSVLSTNRKIILNSDSNSGTARIVLSKEDSKHMDSKDNLQLVSQKPLAVSNGGAAPEKVVVKADVRKQDQYVIETVKANSNNSGSSSGSNIKGADTSKDSPRAPTTTVYGFPDEAYKKRPCNCTKSQCLKLYCDCFANGEYCYNCNCKDCFNTFDHDNERQKAIRSTLERNPNAFKPKIGSIGSTDDGTRLHTKGCNCKRSGCLKNYCECYEGKIACSSNCKCVGCRNTDQFTLDYDYYSSNDASRKSIDDGHRHVSLIVPDKIDSDTGVAHSSMNSVGLKRSSSILDADLSQLPPAKQPHNFMTMDVIEATVQCMVAQADECLKRGCSMRTSELMILEEYGRCLLEIKEFAFNTEN